jgi:dihydrofolate reductase
VIVLTFVSIDGVMQGPGGPTEDPSGGFTLGGWTVDYFDDFIGDAMTEQMGRPFDLLLGMRTYEIFASYWPHVKDGDDLVGAEAINSATKYVVSHTQQTLEWENSMLITGDVVAQIKRLKVGDGPQMQVHGSSNLIQTLMKHDLVDELWLKIFPVTLGTGKRLFGEGTMPAAFRLLESKSSPSGVIVATYARAGDMKLGSFTVAPPD